MFKLKNTLRFSVFESVIDYLNCMQTFLEAVSDEDKSLFCALIDEGFETAFNGLLATNAGGSLEEQVATFVRVLEDFTIEEPNKEELLSALQRKDASGDAVSTSSASAGAAEKARASAPAATSPSFVRTAPSPAASPARAQQNENAVEGRTYVKVRHEMMTACNCDALMIKIIIEPVEDRMTLLFKFVYFNITFCIIRSSTTRRRTSRSRCWPRKSHSVGTTRCVAGTFCRRTRK